MAYQILMIDDEREMIGVGKLILERAGFKVLYAQSGVDGLDILNKEKNNVSLVLLDIMMGGMNGWQVLEKIRADNQYATLPIIMLTARPIEEDKSKTSNYAHLFNSYVVKPFVVRDLLGKINDLINKKEAAQTS